MKMSWELQKFIFQHKWYWRGRCKTRKRRFISEKRHEVFREGKVGPVDGTDHIGEIIAASILSQFTQFNT